MNARPVVTGFVDRTLTSVEAEDPALMAELKVLWRREQERLPSGLLGCEPTSFDSLEPHLANVLGSIEVVVENSLSDQRLDFTTPRRRYIVVGGNVLARGLTIEGLVASFFLRTSSQYDSLMQMGRWFGYRRGYEDLPRIWMTADMADYFRDMATVEAEIRNDIAVYDRENLDPTNFAVRIRRHPVLAITARNKMMAARECHVSFSGKHVQTRKFRHNDEAWLERNWQAGAALVDRVRESAGGLDRRGEHLLFSGVPVAHVVEFLRTYGIHDAHEDLHPDRIISYIAEQNARDGDVLGTWNVAIVGTGEGCTTGQPLGGLGRVPTVIRSRLENLMRCGSADIKALMTRADATVDLDIAAETGSALSWDDIKKRREDQQCPPLLLLYPIDRVSRPRRSTVRKPLDAVTDVLGMAIVFPKARVDTPVGYVCAQIDTSGFEDAEYTEERIQEGE